MAVQATDYDPTDLIGQEERAMDRRRRAIAVAHQHREDLVWLLSGMKGRRKVRQELREAGLHTSSDVVDTVFSRHHGQMCTDEAMRVRGVRLIWAVMRLLASGELPFENFSKLMTEKDE